MVKENVFARVELQVVCFAHSDLESRGLPQKIIDGRILMRCLIKVNHFCRELATR